MRNSTVGVIFVVLVAFVASATAERRYDGDQILAVPVAGVEEWNHVLDILHKHIPIQEIDIWKEPMVGRPGYFRLPLKYASDVFNDFKDSNIEFKIKNFDIQMMIEHVAMENNRVRSLRQNAADIVGTFARYDDILAWIREITDQYPEIAGTFSIGNTYENRPMQVLRLGVPGASKWKVWIDAGVHAREWLAPTTAIYIVDQIVKGWANRDPEIVLFLEKLDFHILPVGNPDGYEYTHTTERLWRKNRKPNTEIGSGCVGTDLNRNFGFHWGGVGSESDPCSNLYRGQSVESEVETKNMIQHILTSADTFIMYKSYHTWGELFFTRWDYTAAEVPIDHEELLSVAQKAVDAINAVNNEKYQAGTAPILMYPFAGGSADWARGGAQIKYPYLTELRDADGNYGFVAPVSEIIPCGVENWAGLQILLREIISVYGNAPAPAHDTGSS